MKLKIRRDQADVKGLFGGHKGVRFSLFAKVDVTDEERSLINKYKVEDYVLASYERPQIGSSEGIHFELTVNDIISGRKTEMNSISRLLELEDAIKEGCHNLKNLLEVMRTFGGEETIEI